MSLYRTTIAFLVVVSCQSEIGVAQDAAQPDQQVAEIEAVTSDQIRGAWVLAGTPDRVVDPEPGARMKFFGDHHWIITEADPETGDVRFHHGGKYKLDGDTYIETITFANENTATMIGSKFQFKMKLDDGVLIQVGVGNPWREVWKRPKE